MTEIAKGDPTRPRAYLEQSCQLGNPMACEELGKRLSAGCTEECYATDPEEAKAALEIACAAGWVSACT